MDNSQFIKLKYANGDESILKISDISSISISDKQVYIFVSGRENPIEVINASSREMASKIYQAIENRIPHQTIATVSL